MEGEHQRKAPASLYRASNSALLGDSLKGPFPLDALIVSQRHRPPCARVAPGGLVDGGLCRRGPGRFRGGRSWGKISESRPTMRRPALKLSSRCPKNGSAGDSHLPCPSRWGAGACTGPASKSELFGNRSVPQRRVSAARECSGDFLPPSPPA
jgi:hypothetical protein